MSLDGETASVSLQLGALGSESMERSRCLVVLPVGPGEELEFVADTISSVLHYCLPTTEILILDDSGKGLGRRAAGAFERTHSIPSVRSIREIGGGYNTLGSFWNQLATAYAYALQSYSFDFILRIDTDSLVIGPEPEADAAAS